MIMERWVDNCPMTSLDKTALFANRWIVFRLQFRVVKDGKMDDRPIYLDTGSDGDSFGRILSDIRSK